MREPEDDASDADTEVAIDAEDTSTETSDNTDTSDTSDTSSTSKDDTILGLLQDDRIDAGAGDDIVDGRAGDDRHAGGTGADSISGIAGNDILYCAEIDGPDDGAVDTLSGGEGDDQIHLGEDDIAMGAAGSDTFILLASLSTRACDGF
ncbi:hypothetical protein [Planktotalea sp.]|uniref:calcium-binding protein n=1 Tax=Planktotalea sp. TaxID=2029877 RepID=UPI0025F1BCCA|nr:hypothetical protein [Planktotalea sp.]